MSNDKFLRVGGENLPKNYVTGLNLLPNATYPAYKIDIEDGLCKSGDDSTDIEVTATLIIDITASGANGLDTGSEASSTWYYVWVIYDPASDTVAGLLSTSSTSPTMPSGYTKKRRVGSIYNEGDSDIRDFQMTGNSNSRFYMWLSLVDERVALSGGSATTPTAVDLSDFIPATSTSASLGGDDDSNTKNSRFYLTTTGPVLARIFSSRSNSVAFFPVLNQAIAYDTSGAGGDASITVMGYMEDI